MFTTITVIETRHTSTVDQKLAAAAFGDRPGSWPLPSATTAGRAVPLTFLIAAVGVLLVAYSFVRLCQYFHHSGSVYAFVGATLGPRTGVVAGWGLVGTYLFYAVVTASASATSLPVTTARTDSQAAFLHISYSRARNFSVQAAS